MQKQQKAQAEIASMSFSFGFASDEPMDGDEALAFASGSTAASRQPTQDAQTQSSTAVPSRQFSLEEMMAGLPDRISYSFIRIPGGGGRSHPPPQSNTSETPRQVTSQDLYLPRRDLFDARFQILHDGFDAEDGAEVDASAARAQKASDEEDVAVVGTESDLIPGLYEGGLKTWECSVDLVSVLADAERSHTPLTGRGSIFSRHKVVELGCGTALPSVYILQRLLSEQPPPTNDDASTQTHLHLCDFNSKVLELVTLPNLLLAFHLVQQEPEQSPTAGELDLTPECLSAFTAALESRGIQLHFHSGPWSGLSLSGQTTTPDAQVDLVLTSETTYSLTGVRDLVQTLKKLSRPGPRPESSSLGPQSVALSLSHSGPSSPTVNLVSTKDYYFGLGGGLIALRDALHTPGLASSDDGTTPWTETIREYKAGVARTVLGLGWGPAIQH